jgi:hypothetical protein
VITLVLIVCLAGAPEVCREERPPLEAPGTMACIVEGQRVAAQWLEEHPKWRMRAWRCEIGPRRQDT